MAAGNGDTRPARGAARRVVLSLVNGLFAAHLKGDEEAGPRAMQLIVQHDIQADELRQNEDEGPVAIPPGLEPVKRERPKPRRAFDIVPDILAESSLPTITTGLSNLDQLLGGGLRARTMTVLVAGSGRGKTSLAAFIAAHHAERAPAIYYSAELTPAQLVARVVAQRTGRSWRDTLTGEVVEDDMRRALDPLSLYIFGRLPDPIGTLSAAVDDIASQGEGTPLLVVDYAQLVADVTADMRTSVMGAVRGIHQLTESRDVVTLLLAQGNRNSTRAMRAGEGSAVEYADAGGETAALEQSAATVLALLYDPADGAVEHEVTIAVAKARYGATGKVGALFHGPSGAYKPTDAAPPPASVQSRRQAVLGALDTSLPATRSEVAARAGGRRQAVLETINVLIAEGAIRELPGGALLRHSGA